MRSSSTAVLLGLGGLLLALASCGGGYASKSDGSWRPYQPQQAEPGAAWAQRQAVESSRPRAERSPVRKAMRSRPPQPAPMVAAEPPSRPSSDSDGARPKPTSRPKYRFSSDDRADKAPRGGGESGGSAGGKRDDNGTAKADADKGGDAANDDGAAARSIVYLGYLRLEVARRVEAMQRIEALLSERKGFVERMAGNVVVLRVPAGDFEAAMNAFASVGKVLDRRIQALDVSAQFQDLEGRLLVSRRARERMLALLARTTNVDERLRLVAEIKRLSNTIEEIESTLASLRDLVAFQTITVELVARDQNGKGVWRRSAFPWVRALMPGRPGPRSPHDRVHLEKVEGFVTLRDSEPFTARAADSSVVTIARVPNEPAGDAAFWARAIAWELQGRGDEPVAEGKKGEVFWQVWRARDPRPWTWLLAVRVVGDEVWIFDAFVPDPQGWKRHEAALLEAAGRFEVTP